MDKDEKKTEVRGKSWKREREERGRRQLRSQTPNDGDVKPTKSSIIEEAVTEDIVEVDQPSAECISDAQPILESTGVDSSQPLDDEKQPEVVDTQERDVEDEEKEQLHGLLHDISERLQGKADLRDENKRLSAERPEENFFSKLDSSLKKNTAFVKRLKNLTDTQRDSLIKDMKTLNLTKYISEAASAIVEAKLKISDVNTAVQVCSLLHQRYADFSSQLLENWQKVLPLKKDEKILNPSKIRVDLRFYAELITCGVFTLKEGLPMLGNLLTLLTANDKEEHNNLNIILSFCKHCGEDYAALVPRALRLLVEKHGGDIPRSILLPADRQKGLKALLKDYYKSVSRHLLRDHKNLHNMDRQNMRMLHTKGELANDRKEKYEAAQAAFHKLLAATQQLAEILDEDVPSLPQDELTSPDNDSTSLDVHNRFRDGDLDGMNYIWEDDDTRCFYESLPDLKASIPGILFKDSSGSQLATVGKSDQDESAIEEELNKLDLEDMEAEQSEDSKPNPESDEKTEDVTPIEVTEEPAVVNEVEPELDLTEKLLQEVEDPEEEPGNVPATSNRVILEGFLTTLLHCVSREMIDQSAIDFCMNLNTKPNRRKLVKALFLVPRTRLDLLPFYARFVATLAPCMPDVANDLVSMLKQDFKFHIKKKDQINIESKIKSVRFIGELVKFGIYPKNEALFCLKMLLFDFSHHHIEMACNLLETCGRFLFRSPESHQRTKVYLEQMMRKNSVMALDSRYSTMVENAFYYCNPPEAQATVKIERPPLHNYIRKLLYKDLSKNNTEKILRQMRKLAWDDPDMNAYATKCLSSIWNVKFYNIRCVANLLAGLVAYQETVGPQVMDSVLEEIRLGMEMNLPKYNQRRVSMVRYLGELYNYRMVESSVIFKVLYSFITFGVNYDGSYSELDAPENLFRLRLVCTLLDTCGQYFNNGSSKKKLDCFLIFYQRYYMQKKCHSIFGEGGAPFPVTVLLMVKETLTTLRPKLKLCENFEDADKAVQILLDEFRPKLVEVIPSLGKSGEGETGELGGEENSDDPLGPIQEEAEGEEDYDFGSEQEDMLSGSQSQPIDEDDVEERTGSISEDESRRGRSGDRQDEDDEYQEEGGGEERAEGDEVTLINSSSKHQQCQEDDDFMAAFDKILSESILHRTQEPLKPQVDIVIPMNIKSGQLGISNVPVKKAIPEKPSFADFPSLTQPPSFTAGLLSGHSLPPTFPSTNEGGVTKPTINFLLMTRRGNKQQFKSLEVPMTSEMALNLRDREKAERAEKEQVKKLTLNINERQEEEDYQEMLAAQQRPVVMNLNRDRRHRYQHPKGAPDADLIFGNNLKPASSKPLPRLHATTTKTVKSLKLKRPSKLVALDEEET